MRRRVGTQSLSENYIIPNENDGSLFTTIDKKHFFCK